MVRISKHGEKYKSEIKAANIKISLNKYNFSQEFAERIHKFSEEHHKDHFKTFNVALEEWSTNNKEIIEKEIEYITKTGFDGKREEIEHKIKISARFYYRKKEKREKKIKQQQLENKEENDKDSNQSNNQQKQRKQRKKPYIGLSQTFIQVMDEYIKNEILKNASNIKIKKIFAEFTQLHIEDIKEELNILKIKYDDVDEVYEPMQIADKIKKAFENRYNIFVHLTI